MDTVYTHIRHWLFWYGVYGLCDKSCNDEITTRTSLEYLVNNEIDKLEDTELYNEMRDFLKSDSNIYYSYIYPRDNQDVVYQVKHYASSIFPND